MNQHPPNTTVIYPSYTSVYDILSEGLSIQRPLYPLLPDQQTFLYQTRHHLFSHLLHFPSRSLFGRELERRIEEILERILHWTAVEQTTVVIAKRQLELKTEQYQADWMLDSPACSWLHHHFLFICIIIRQKVNIQHIKLFV